MAINKVGSKGIEDCSVAAIDFAPGTVSSDKFAPGTIENAKLTNSSITAAGTSISLGGSTTINNQFVDWQSKITSDGSTVTTMVAGRGYFVDNTSAAGLVKLPASANIGDFVAIKDYAGNFGTNSLTIQRNSHKIQGVANDGELSTNKASVVLVYVDATKGWLYWEESNVGDLTPAFTEATGGTVTTSGNDKIHTFTGDGCFVVSQVGNSPTAPAGGPNTVEYLVVAGGGAGSGGHSNRAAGGGGGAGGYRASGYGPSPLRGSAITLSAQTYPITVGGGGAACGTKPGSSGSNSVFSTITSAGGGHGYGGNAAAVPVSKAGDGGSGGGGDYGGSPTIGSGNTPPVSPPQGSNGGQGYCNSCYPAGGGGGITAVGGNGPNPATKGGCGGAGAPNNIDGGSGVTAFTDSSPNSFSITRCGATHDSSITKFNNTSVFFDGNDKLTTAENSAFTRGTGDWTLEFWIYKTEPMTNNSIVMQQDTSGGSNGFQVEFTSSKVTLYNYELDNNWTIRAQENSAAAVGAWNHYAFVRASNVHTLYLNGTAQTTTNTNSGSHAPQYEGLIWGSHRSDSGRFLKNAFLDGMRFSDTARYTSNFTAPTDNFSADSNTIFLLQSSGVARHFAGGGGGGAGRNPCDTHPNSDPAIPGGLFGYGGGGMGAGGSVNVSRAGTANIGGGGGGGAAGNQPHPQRCGSSGGKGIVILRYRYQ